MIGARARAYMPPRVCVLVRRVKNTVGASDNDGARPISVVDLRGGGGGPTTNYWHPRSKYLRAKNVPGKSFAVQFFFFFSIMLNYTNNYKTKINVQFKT